jgi:3-hydroxybutyryl-CoA dehydratase
MRNTALASAALRAARACVPAAEVASGARRLRCCCSPPTAHARSSSSTSSTASSPSPSPSPPPSDANNGQQQQHIPLAPGARLERRATFSLADVARFTALTGDANPLHTDAAAATTSAPIVPGLLLASLFPAIIGTAFPGALYLKQSLSFRRSARAGADVVAEVAVTRGGGGSTRVLFDTVCRCAATGAVLVDGTALARIPPSAGGGGGGGCG